MRPALLIVLLGGCTAPPAPTPEPEPAVVAPEPAEEAPPRREPMTDENGRRFPFEAFRGRWRCDVEWLRGRSADEDPDEGERSNVIIEIGENPHAPTHLTTTIEGCPFFVSGIAPGGASAWNLGPNRCGDTRYHDGFLLLDEGDRTYPHPSFAAQTQGRVGLRYISHAYTCYTKLRVE